MAFEMNDMNGSLFKSDAGQKRDYNGSCKVNGVEMWISAWIKTGPSGIKYFSMAFEPKQQQPLPPQQEYQQAPQQTQYQQPAQQQQQPQYQQPVPQQNQQPQQGNQQPQQNNGGDYAPPFSPTDDVPF
jgi:hypothetical protein